MSKSFCFFFQKEVLSSCRCVSLKATWYNISNCCIGEASVLSGKILSEPEERLSRAEIIARAVP
jgi:hypothetical protein